MGLAYDNMLSAKIILADGRLVYADNVHQPDLFWAIKGAGFYFGVTEITLRTYSLSIFGTEEGRHWIGNFLYPLERAAEVFRRQENWDKVFGFEQRAIETMRLGTEPESYVDLLHGTRIGPIERRFRGPERLTKLRALKKEFDPRGAFTTEFL
ncbi:hypothetical protein OEA41_004042 [Lepraria neglecta]|uniref:Uncharacterized protein n=1 Tax=Lepraria neglecta TaxID=209136 RepID=A0AAE0DM12_9LECA|nr:hypothetical protein OEA41_004042 [Lepraria neglecta]